MDVDLPGQELISELEKWRECCKALIEIYDSLNKKLYSCSNKSTNTKEIIKELKEKVDKLNTLLYHATAENRILNEKLEKQNNISENQLKIAELAEENETLKQANEILQKQLNNIKKDYKILENERIVSSKLVQQLNIKIKVWNSKNNKLETQRKTSNNFNY